MKKNYIAFTMAEVLITLGIIGVVAAMTFPGLLGHYQKKSTAVKVQKFYTIFNQAMMLRKSKTENIKIGFIQTLNFYAGTSLLNTLKL